MAHHSDLFSASKWKSLQVDITWHHSTWDVSWTGHHFSPTEDLQKKKNFQIKYDFDTTTLMRFSIQKVIPSCQTREEEFTKMNFINVYFIVQNLVIAINYFMIRLQVDSHNDHFIVNVTTEYFQNIIPDNRNVHFVRTEPLRVRFFIP